MATSEGVQRLRSRLQRAKREEDAGLFTEAIVIAALQDVIAMEGGQRQAARLLNISPQYVNDVLQGRRDVSAELADRLGFERVTKFRRKEP
jgi:hypothetical protein